METLWKIKNLDKRYTIRSGPRLEEVIALDDISMEIFRGETFGVIGESGSGKTTLGKTMIRLVEPDSGQVYFNGIDITGLSRRELLNARKNFQIVFQDPYRSLNPRMTTGSAVAEGIPKCSKAEKRNRVKELFEMVGISSERVDDFPHQFSGGEKQRVSIARALSTSPVFIVCDEPTSNLDLSIQAKILNLFIELKEKMDLTYLFISHNIKVVEFIADRIAVMYAGQIVEYGSTPEVIGNPLHPYTKLLISSAFFKGADVDKRTVNHGKGGCSFVSSCPYSEDVCLREKPLLKQVKKDHFVACFRYG
jgi:oligopeptide/dipeptide ABC transporter ATP-binding protein